MDLLVIEERRNVLVALSTNVAHIKICFLHVFSHVNSQLYFVEQFVTTRVAREPSKLHFDMLVRIHVRRQCSNVCISDATDHADLRILMRVDVLLEIGKKLEV